MREDEFKNWLSSRLKKRSTKDCISRCKKAEKALQANLDIEYNIDNGTRVLNTMQYSIEDEKKGKEPPAGFSFKPNSSIRFGMTALRCAVNTYFKFCKEFPLK